MIRCDENNVPTLVQQWTYGPARLFDVTLLNGNVIYLDMWEVRDHSCKNYHKRDEDKDGMAVDQYVKDYQQRFFCTAPVK